MTTVDEIQSRVAAVVDQDNDTANIASSDYSLRLNYLNRRERAWAESGKWQTLVKEFNTLTSTNTANTSVSLPADFRTLSSFPKISYDGVNTESFAEIRPQEEGQFKSSDRYVKIMGSPYAGYTMIVHPGTSSGVLASGSSIKVLYFSTPTSLASPSNAVQCPNPEYLVQGVIADVWEAREDARYQAKQVEANLILQNMIEFENTPSEAAYNRQVKTIEATRYAFRWGR